MSYVDGFLFPVPSKNLKAYQKIAKLAAKVWIEHGAIDYKECVGDDLLIKGMRSFNKTTPMKKGEVILFSYIVYKSRADRDKINKKVMKDPRISEMCNSKAMPFDVKRMAYGGFKVLVDGK